MSQGKFQTMNFQLVQKFQESFQLLEGICFILAVRCRKMGKNAFNLNVVKLGYGLNHPLSISGQVFSKQGNSGTIRKKAQPAHAGIHFDMHIYHRLKLCGCF